MPPEKTISGSQSLEKRYHSELMFQFEKSNTWQENIKILNLNVYSQINLKSKCQYLKCT